MTDAPPGNPGGARVEMRGESRDSSTFTQIGTQVIQQPPLPEQAFGHGRSWPPRRASRIYRARGCSSAGHASWPG